MPNKKIRAVVHPPSPNMEVIPLPTRWSIFFNDTTNPLSAHIMFLIQTADQLLIGVAGRWDRTIKKAKKKKKKKKEIDDNGEQNMVCNNNI